MEKISALCKSKPITIAVTILLLIIIMVPFIMVIRLSYPIIDDIGFAVNREQGNIITNCIQCAINFYMNWSGTLVITFFQFLLNPFTLTADGFSNYSLFLCLNYIFFVLFSVYFVLFLLNKVFLINDLRKKCLLLVAVISVILNSGIYTEIFNWYTGSAYMWSVCVGFIAIMFFIYYCKTDKTRFIAGGCLSGFVACTILPCAVPVCGFYMFLLAIRKQKLRKRDFLPIVCCVAGALSSVLSPGMFVRQNIMDSSGIHPIYALIQTGKAFCESAYKLLSSPVVFVFLLIVFVLGIFSRKTMVYEMKRPVLTLLWMVVCTYGCLYPVVLGYSYSAMPNRICYIFNMFSLFFVGMYVFFLGKWIAKKYCLKLTGLNKLVMIMALVVCGLICVFPMQNGENIPYVQYVAHYNEASWYSAVIYDCINELRESSDTHVHVEKTYVREVDILLPWPITMDPEDYFNKQLGEYIGKESITVQLVPAEE